MRKYEQGEIVEIIFPFEDINDKKIRPALVINDNGDNLLVIKITSKHKERKWDILIPKDDFNGLSVNSVIQIDKIKELSKKELCSVIPRGNINPLQLAIIKQKLSEYYAGYS